MALGIGHITQKSALDVVISVERRDMREICMLNDCSQYFMLFLIEKYLNQ
jgi:hypothetical protein